MKSFAKIITIFILFIVSAFIYANSSFKDEEPVNLNKEYIVDVSRISRQIEECGIENIDLSRYEFVFAVEKYNGEDFYNTTNEYRAHLKTPSKQEHKRHGTKKAIFIPKRSKYRLK